MSNPKSKRHLFKTSNRSRQRLINRYTTISYLSIVVERIIQSLWRPLTWALIMTGIMMLSLPEVLAHTGWIIIGTIFWVGFIFLLFRDIRKIKLPTRAKALKRAHEDAGTDYRPLEVLEDSPAGLYSAAKRKIWSSISGTAKEDAKIMAFSLPRPKLSHLDSYGLRYISIILFGLGLFLAGNQAQTRLMKGLFPFGGLGDNNGLSFTLWISPPPYTGLRDIVIDQSRADAFKNTAIKIPEGSQIKASISDLWGPASLSLGYVGNDKAYHSKFEHTSSMAQLLDITIPDLPYDESYIIADIEAGLINNDFSDTDDVNRMDVIQFDGTLSLNNIIRSFETYDIKYMPDQTPIVFWNQQNDSTQDNIEETKETTQEQNDLAFEKNPQKNDEGHNRRFGMSFPITTQDDYGVNMLELHIALPEEFKNSPYIKGETIFTKPLAPLAGKPYISDAYFDLSDHPWAGLPINAFIRVSDEAGQTVDTDIKQLTLRERNFTQILAKRLVELRKDLIWGGHHAFKNVAFDLSFQLKYPEDMRNDPTLWLRIRQIRDRLQRSIDNITDKENTARITEDIVSKLWLIALDLEDMGLSSAARKLDRATAKLTRGLKSSRRSDEEKLELFDDYKDAMRDYLDKLNTFRQNRDGAPAGSLSSDITRDLMDPQPLQDLLRQMEDMAQSGDFKSLEEMMGRLQALMDFLARGGGMPPDLEAMERGLNVLGGLIDNQKYLLGDTQELAPLVPDHVKKPQKSFGELLPVPQDLMSEWKDLNATEMPPAPSLPDMSRQNDDMIFDDTNPEQESTDLDLQPQENIQEVLRFILGELIGEVYDFTSELPETMPQAELEMRNSTTTLDDQRPDLSVPIQEEVIRLLEQAQQDLQEQMQEQMEQRTGMQMRQGQTDPLGRPQGEEEYIGPREDSDVEVPDQFDRRRIDEILEYLRKHAGDPERSRIEREYFKRLLRAF